MADYQCFDHCSCWGAHEEDCPHYKGLREEVIDIFHSTSQLMVFRTSRNRYFLAIDDNYFELNRSSVNLKISHSKKYDKSFGDEKICTQPNCGHTYYRHFDWMEDFPQNVYCKYCGCSNFKE